MKVARMKELLVKGAFFGGCVLLIWLAGRYLVPWFLPFLAGYLIAYMLRPAAGFIRRHSGMGPRGASIVSAILFYGALGAITWLLGAYLFGRIQALGDMLPQLYESGLRPILSTLRDRIGEIAGSSKIGEAIGTGTAGALDIVSDALGGAASSASQWGMELLGKLAAKIPMMAITLVFTVLSSVLICMDYERVCKTVMRLIPSERQELTLEVRDYLLGTLGKAVKAYLILMAVTFAELSIGLWLLKINSFWIAAALIAIFDILPVIGSGAVLLPWAGYMLLTGNTATGWGMVALWLAICAVREVLEPRVLSGQLGLHPLAAVTAMYAGLKIAGAGGLIVAPIACLLARYLYRRDIIHLW